MKALALSLALLFGTAVFAGHVRDWHEATVVSMTSRVNDNGAAVIPIGASLYGVRLRSTTIWYKLDAGQITYVVAQVLTGHKKPLNITLHGTTKIAIDGSNAHILDDAGKDIKLPIVQKIAD